MAEFDPDAYLAKRKAFDPDEYLRKKREAEAPRAPGHWGLGRTRNTVIDTPEVQDPTEQMFVSREAATDPRSLAEKAKTAGEYYGEMVPMAADSATFGLGNRGVAYGRSLLDSSAGANYGKHIEEQNAYLNKLREADPDRAVFSELLGGVAGGSALAKGGITLAKPSVGWIERGLRGGAEGIAQGAAQGAGGSYGTLEEKLLAGGKGAAMGGVLGTSVPLATTGAAGVKTLADMYRGQVPRYGSPSVLRAVEADRPRLETLSSMGPDAMLVDTPSMRRVAAGAQTTPGYGATRMEQALVAREGETPLRLREGLRKQFGDMPINAEVQREIDAAADALSPHWETAFKNAKAVNTEGIANWLDSQAVLKRGPAAEAYETVRKSLNIKGVNELDPDPRTLHETRQMIDGFMFDQSVNQKAKDAYGIARAKISEELHEKVPGMANLDAKHAEVMSRLDAYKRGKQIFRTGEEQYLDPSEWTAEKAGMALPKGGPRSTVADPSLAPKYSELGTRHEIGRLIEMGSDELRKLENTFGPYKQATEHLKTQFGVQNVEDFRHMLTTNREFRDSYSAILKGSQTANKVEAAADIDRPYTSLVRAALHPKQVATEALDRAEAGFGASMRNRITEMLATRQGGRDPATGMTFDELRRDLLQAAEQQKRHDISRIIAENALRRGGTATIPRLTK